MDGARRAAAYNAAHAGQPAVTFDRGWLVGTWLIGACYKNPNKLYGAHPRGYLERVMSMFPDAEQVLHAFSGGLTLAEADAALAKSQNQLRKSASDCPRRNIELVDLVSGEGRTPTVAMDILEYCRLWPRAGAVPFDLVMADPPYSAADAKLYGTPMVDRKKVMRSLREVTRTGGNLVWLDQVWPMHRKQDWRCWGQIGLVRSTNHRVRLVSFFEAA